MSAVEATVLGDIRLGGHDSRRVMYDPLARYLRWEGLRGRSSGSRGTLYEKPEPGQEDARSFVGVARFCGPGAQLAERQPAKLSFFKTGPFEG